MFYCQPCATENEWPDDFYLPKSYGPCEMCGKGASCFDVPSSHLPPAKPKSDVSEQDEVEAIASIADTIEKRSK